MCYTNTKGTEDPEEIRATSRAEMTIDQTKVAIVGGDPVVGRTLETLLQGGGYGARFLYKLAEDELSELLADSQLLLIVPPLGGERRRGLQKVMFGPAPVEIAVLELLPANGGGEPVQLGDVLFWPCSAEELKRAVDAALITRK
jgi:hypothetical protein